MRSVKLIASSGVRDPDCAGREPGIQAFAIGVWFSRPKKIARRQGKSVSGSHNNAGEITVSNHIRFLKTPLTVAIASIGSALVAPDLAQAQAAAELQLEEIVVTGTRKEGLSPTQTLSPIDVVGGDMLSNQSSFDLTESLTRVSPSLNTQRFPIADGTALIRPVTLRNLAPDHTLVLMNGSRRHRSALVNLQLAPLGTVNQGSQAVDWAAFPAAAIQRVEVLRDGASAQYGSDAIAGVINVILKDEAEGGSVAAQYGEYTDDFAGDSGQRLSVSGNAGFHLTENGFINLTGEYSSADKTWRGHARPDAAALEGIVPGLVPLEGLGQRWGDPDVEATKFLVNSGIDVNDCTQVYGFATYMDNETESDFFFRRPVLSDPADQQALSARTTLQIDNDGDGLPDPAAQSLVDSITGQGLNPADYLVADAASASGYLLRNPIYTEFPGGYNPTFGAQMEDIEFVLGTRGQMPNDERFTWDVRGRYGENEVEYELGQSINPSLGRLSPLSFNPGTLVQEESGLNVDFVKSFADSPLNIAFGAEWRRETYEIEQGDEASWSPGPTAAIFGVGSDGFQGFAPDTEGEWDSDSWAAYLDVETEITDRLQGAIAVRYEDYEEFDDTFDGKLSLRYDFTDNFAVRATTNTGFRVPTPGQVNTLNVTTTSDSSGNLIPAGTFPVDHPVSQVLGSQALEPEESFAYTAGFVLRFSDNIDMTFDYYHIEIEDRLRLQSNTITQTEVDLLNASGYPNASLLLGSSVAFFVNGYDSEVDGIDITVTGSWDVGGGTLTADLGHNWNQQEVDNVTPGTLNASNVYDLENQVPENKTVITLNWAHGSMFGLLVRGNYYDDWSSTGGLFSPGDASDQYDYDGAFLVDVEASLTFAEHYTLTIGGDNVFDETPEKELDPTLDFLGVEYALTSPYGFNGAFWYLRGAVSF
jgi:iron complex outermembrane receptor protein